MKPAPSEHEQRATEVEARPNLSCVIPIYDEEDNIRPMCQRIAAALEASGLSAFEVVFVENGSHDRSADEIRRQHQMDPRFKMVQLSRNFGYQGGISAGLDHARGEWVAVLDGDQQDPPELIPQLLRRAQEGFDVVYGIRARRQASAWKRVAYSAFYRVWRASAEIQVPPDAGDFCVMHRRVVRAISAMPERQRFVRGLRAWAGFKQTGIPYDRPSRAEGTTKFGLAGMFSLAFDGLLSYSLAPLRFITLVGLGIAGLSFLVGAAEVLIRIAGWLRIGSGSLVLPPGLTQINFLVTFLMGFNILVVGVVGEYVGRIYDEVKQRPIYIVRDRLLDD